MYKLKLHVILQLESDWDEEFITKGFQNMGITIRSLKIIKNKVTGYVKKNVVLHHMYKINQI